MADSIMRVNLGCGPDAPAGWTNVDGSLNAWFSHHPHLRKALVTVGLIGKGMGAKWKVKPLVHDLTKPLPFETGSISAIYGSHMLEHLFYADAQRLLSECNRVLRPGGVVRMVVPDLRSFAKDYLARSNGNHDSTGGAALPADLFNERLGYRTPTPPAGSFLFKFYAVWKDFHSHKWMYDSESLAQCLSRTGFVDVQERQFLDSEIPGIAEVEQADRVLNGAGVCVEAKKR
jgi:SAM-dependent methyltransferase